MQGSKPVNGIVDAIGKLGPQRLAAMGAVTLALMGFFAFVIFRFSQPAMTTLFTDLSLQDSTAIVKELDTRGIKYEMRQDGATIMVPKDNALRLRMDLAGKGMPSGGGVGYEIFDKGDAFSTTNFVQNVNHVRALEGELARTIRALDRVQQARVHLVLPERQLFSREKNEARASIVLKTRGEIDAGQIRAIRHLVATAVAGLKPESVSIVDEAGRLLADGAQSDASASVMADEKQTGQERRIRTQIEDIVASIVGRGRARVQVAAEIDFNRVQQTSESFDPESRVVRSTQTRTENQATTEAKDGQVSVSNELPGAASGGAQGNTKDASNKNEEVVNYEISKTTRNEVIESGRIKRLSVAVLVDGIYTKPAGAAEAVYQPRPPEELERIATLVRSSIGFDAKRGDNVEVVNLRFAEAPLVLEGKELSFTEKLLNFSKDDVLRMAELGILGLVCLLVILLVVRPLLKQISAPERLAKPGMQQMVQGPNGQMQIAGPQGTALVPLGTDPDKMIEISQVNGAIQAKQIDRLGELVVKNPQESISILRQYVNGTA